jgi:hypothetical protein
MTDDDIVGIRMTTPGDIKAFARAIEQKVKEIKMLKIGDRVINIDSITYIIDRNVFFNNGTSWVMTEPEIQDLLAALFNEPRVQEYREVSDDEFLTPVEKAIVNTSGKLPVKPKKAKK